MKQKDSWYKSVESKQKHKWWKPKKGKIDYQNDIKQFVGTIKAKYLPNVVLFSPRGIEMHHTCNYI